MACGAVALGVSGYIPAVTNAAHVVAAVTGIGGFWVGYTGVMKNVVSKEMAEHFFITQAKNTLKQTGMDEIKIDRIVEFYHDANSPCPFKKESRAHTMEPESSVNVRLPTGRRKRF